MKDVLRILRRRGGREQLSMCIDIPAPASELPTVLHPAQQRVVPGAGGRVGSGGGTAHGDESRAHDGSPCLQEPRCLSVLLLRRGLAHGRPLGNPVRPDHGVRPDPSGHGDRVGRRRHAGAPLGPQDLRGGDVPRRGALHEEAGGVCLRAQLGDPLRDRYGSLLPQRSGVSARLRSPAPQAPEGQGTPEARSGRGQDHRGASGGDGGAAGLLGPRAPASCCWAMGPTPPWPRSCRRT